MGQPPADGELLLRGSDAATDWMDLHVFANADDDAGAISNGRN